MLVYPSGVDVSGSALRFLAARLKEHRRALGTRWRRLSAGRQALLTLARDQTASRVLARHQRLSDRTGQQADQDPRNDTHTHAPFTQAPLPTVPRVPLRPQRTVGPYQPDNIQHPSAAAPRHFNARDDVDLAECGH
ncbi:hypothetical protein GCM10010207_73420 [Streptomyces atratus]|nr:hypothetical protein GCM10010207_73420 [Streptomyces atratus]